ncbi:hypothetical protein L0222_14845 [bacterium]|nr:hypothetical protein [bacterium]MCI0606145.1 hypothetical protein [bacterium]
MIDEILRGLFGEMVFGRLSNSKRIQLIARLFFGLLGSVLAIIGIYHFLSGSVMPSKNLAMRASVLALFLFLGCFSLFNVALGRKWSWPGKFFFASLAALFVTRILFGP